ncbi:RHS repeat domain-containing protein [Apibacter mensalis]|uniref:RHS repeat domain-containing protein n=1 Tax=Apibacter mensalis TaxID=1586267 RepID=UPI0026F0EAFF|nr:RHS repeat-associated core domain-containing protein [Apibacter mensalis]
MLKFLILSDDIKGNYAHFEVPYNGKDNDDYVNGEGFCCSSNIASRAGIGIGNVNYEKMQYYYHPDHLGSSSYITNLDGEIVQHVEYVPFGEVFIEERNNSWNTPYLFNGKELDEETGLYYYGARYYNPRESVWLSVDPLAEKYPNFSPYAYTFQNPIKFIDPDGMEGRPILPPRARQALFALQHPIIATAVGQFKSGSTNLTTNVVRFTLNANGLQGDSGWEGSQVNAYRHTLWQTAITSRYGADIAEQMGNAHEANPDVGNIPDALQKTYDRVWNSDGRHYEINQAGDTVIDQANNHNGRILGFENKGASTKDLALKVLEKFYTKGLYVAVPNDEGKYSIDLQKITKEQYESAKKELETTDQNGFTPSQLEKRQKTNKYN